MYTRDLLTQGENEWLCCREIMPIIGFFLFILWSKMRGEFTIESTVYPKLYTLKYRASRRSGNEQEGIRRPSIAYE